jgi:hypothetical protein
MLTVVVEKIAVAGEAVDMIATTKSDQGVRIKTVLGDGIGMIGRRKRPGMIKTTGEDLNAIGAVAGAASGRGRNPTGRRKSAKSELRLYVHN